MNNKLCIFLILLLPTIVQAQSAKSYGAQGNDAYAGADFATADSLYSSSLALNPELETAAFNKGDALYRQGKFDEAAEQFGKIARESKDDDLRSEAFHNLGNTMMSKQEYEKAIAAYKNSLRLNPEDPDTRYNLAYAKKMLQQQQEQQQNQDQEQNEDGEQEKNENQDQEGENEDQDQNEEGEQEQNQDQNENEDGEQEQNQDQNEGDEQQQEQEAKAMEGKISPEDAARILESLKKKEQDIQKKLRQKKKGEKVKIEKDW